MKTIQRNRTRLKVGNWTELVSAGHVCSDVLFTPLQNKPPAQRSCLLLRSFGIQKTPHERKTPSCSFSSASSSVFHPARWVPGSLKPRFVPDVGLRKPGANTNRAPKSTTTRYRLNKFTKKRSNQLAYPNLWEDLSVVTNLTKVFKPQAH